MSKIIVELKQQPHSYEINICRKGLPSLGEWLTAQLDDRAKRIFIISNTKVFKIYGEKVLEQLRRTRRETNFWLMPDGEKYKNLDSTRKALKHFGLAKIKRDDVVIALGGGVVGDLAGFAAAIYLRGIKFFQIPTTLLAQVDSSVGGKTGVNTDFGKNLIGAFHQPHGVLVALETLQTLPERELRAGFSEIIKHGAIASPELFQQTANLVENFPVARWKKLLKADDEDFTADFSALIAANIDFKAQIVQGDEFEDTARVDSKSRKILNFGHTVGHALEKLTDYKRFKHGEAVALGMLVAAELSKKVASFDDNELNLFGDVLRSASVLPKTSDLDLNTLITLIEADKKAVGNSVKWIVLESIGKPAVIGSEKISETLLRETLRQILGKS